MSSDFETGSTGSDFQKINRAFLYGDTVSAHFFVQNGKLLMAEECYFFLMASMRKMRMKIPLRYTLEFFEKEISEKVISKGFQTGIITVMAYRKTDSKFLQKASVDLFYSAETMSDLLSIQKVVTLDMMKEIFVNDSLLSNLRVHSAENIYAEIYASENDLDDLILLNGRKKMARTIHGNILLLNGNTIRIPKQSEGAYISPLMENFVTFLHKKGLALIQEDEIVGFETQKAEEILIISDNKGIFAVDKIRNKTFPHHRFEEMILQWKDSFRNLEG